MPLCSKCGAELHRKAPAKRLPGPSLAEKRAAKMERHAGRVAAIRAEVMRRDHEQCVVCGEPATECHHLVYGAGMRRTHESVATCASLCRLHHDAAHAGLWATLETLQLWASAHGYWLANEALVRRLDKIAARQRRRP